MYVPFYEHYALLLFCKEGTVRTFSFRVVFFYLVTTGWILTSTYLCENSIKQYLVNVLIF